MLYLKGGKKPINRLLGHFFFFSFVLKKQYDSHIKENCEKPLKSEYPNLPIILFVFLCFIIISVYEHASFYSSLNIVEKEMATHSRVLAWRIPGMAEPGGLPSMGSHRVGHD